MTDNSHSSSSQHILITYAEYERLKNVEKQFEQLQQNLHKKLQIPNAKHGAGVSESEDNDDDRNTDIDDALIQSTQSGGGTKRKFSEPDLDYHFISKVANLVSERLSDNSTHPPARPVISNWSNYDLSPPSTSVIGNVNTNPPLPYNQPLRKNDSNDEFDEQRLLKLIPTNHRHRASSLLKQFDARGNELSWNSDGIIFVDQTSIPNSNIFALFPYLFKQKHPKTLQGFDDFINKIREMGLEHLIVKRPGHTNTSPIATPNTSKKRNWWYLG